MTRTVIIVEEFAEYRELGIPSLRAWKRPKTMTVDWHYGRVREYWKFQSVLDSDGMNAALLEVWRRCKPQCDRRAPFGHGKSGGHLSCVSHDAGAAAMAIIREHYSKALQAMRATGGDDRDELASEACCSSV
jgi:hypothetical protein